MILACLHFVLAYFISYKSLGYLPLHLSRSEKIAASAVLAPFLSAWITFATWILLGRVRGGGVSLIILTLITLILVLVRRPSFKDTQNEPVPTKSAHKALYAVFWLLLCLILGWLTYNHYLMPTIDGWHSSGYTWGDIAIHMSLASWFAKQPDLLLVWPIFKDTKMFYTFLADLGTAQLLSYGASYQLAFGLPTLSLLLGCTRLTFGLVYRLTRSLRASLIHINFVLFSGSAAGVMYALYDFLNPTRASIMPDYTNLTGDTQLNFANLITSHLLPQRSYLLGFGVTSLILIMVYQLYKRHRGESFAHKLSEKRLVFTIATLTGLLPFAHVHSFLVLMGVYVSILLWELFRRDRLIRDWLYILGISSLIALPQLYWQAITTPKGMTRTNFGWMMTEGSNIVWFWVLNLGLLLLFFILILWLLYSLLRNRHQHHTYHIRDTDSFTGILFGFGVTLFIAGNLIQFLPNI
nr:hypothetical protein [Candidatus Saccharibacteria bacterium]